MTLLPRQGPRARWRGRRLYMGASMGRRAATSVGRVAITIAVLWLAWTWFSGDAVMVSGPLPTSGTCPLDVPCTWLRPEIRIAGKLVLPHQVASGIVIATAVLIFSRWRLRQLRHGPMRLTDVILFDPAGATSITALIMECLRVRDVRAHGVIPSYSGIDARSTDLQGTPVYPAPGGLLTRYLAALAQSSVVNQGFTVTVTQTPAQRPYQVGLTFSIQRVATGAIELVETCWSADLEEGARKVGFRLVAWREESMRRWGRHRRPGATPNASSMRHQYAALIEGWHRRYDGAVHFAREGLRVDPGNVALRLHLGETYERLGLGLDAMIVYASGLIGLDDRRNGWRNRASEATAENPALAAVEASAWADGRKRRRPEHRDADSATLLWRYVANLGMAERWADLLVAETARVDDVYRNPTSSAGNHPWFTERRLAGWPAMPGSQVDLEWSVSEARERSGLVRGFLAKRYNALLEDQFPLLNEAWFQERKPREQPFPAYSAQQQTAEHVAANVLERSLHGRVRQGRDLPPPTGRPNGTRLTIMRIDEQVGDLRQAIEALIRLHYLAWHGPRQVEADDAGVRALYDGGRRCFTAALGYVIAPATTSVAGVEAPHTLRAEDRRRLFAEHRALRAMLSDDVEEWKPWRLNRPLVIACVTRLIAQLSAVHRYVTETYPRVPGMVDPVPSDLPRSLDDALHAYSELFGRVAASVDLQLVLSVCAMRDLEDLLAGEAETPPLADVRRTQLLWTMAQHRFCARLLYLERANGFTNTHEIGNGAAFLKRADELMLATHERIEHILDGGRRHRLTMWVLEVLSSLRWRRPMLGRDDEPWSQAYYAACAYAVTIPDYPGSIDGEASPMRGGGDQEPNLTVDNSYHKWCRRYDAVAKMAIHHLDEAVSLRARSPRTGRSRGVADWILDEDPDLDLLRRHPRFRRWAAQRFQVTILPDWRSPAFRAMRSRRFHQAIELPDRAASADHGNPPTVLFREACSLGVLGSSVPWNRSYVRWGLTHTHYLIQGLVTIIPAVIDRLEALGRSMAASSSGSSDLGPASGMLGDVADDLVRLWSTVPLYRTLNTSPELRLELGILLRRLGGLQHTLWPQFPREADVLLEARFLDFAKLEPRLCRRAPQGLAAAISLQRMADGAQPLNGIAHGTVTVLRASTRHLAGLLADVEASFASSPSRRSLRQRSTEGALLVDGADEGG